MAKKMMANCKENGQWSLKKMEGEEGLKTLQCLRGRLLAERQATKSAKEEEELLVKKLMELEDQMRNEIELKNKAEKRLQSLINKLESLHIASISVKSEHSTSSEASTNSSLTKEIEEPQLKSENAVSTIAENRIEDKNHQNRSNPSPNYEFPKSSCTDPHEISRISQIKDHSFSVEANERDYQHYEDKSPESAADFPANSAAANSESRELRFKPGHVLDALKQIKENYSFERRHNLKAIISM